MQRSTDMFHLIPVGFFCPRLLHDRELDLYDGTRLLRWDRYQTLKEQLQFSDQQLQERYMYKHTHTGQQCTHLRLKGILCFVFSVRKQV